MSSLMWPSKWDDNKSSMWNFSNVQDSDVDVSKVWSSKTDYYDDNNNLNSQIQSIWSSNTNEQNIETVTTNENQITPTNSPSIKRNEIVLSTEPWGTKTIDQITPWEVGDVDEEIERRTSDPMVWRAKVDGTEVWEDYYARQHGKRRPQSDSNYSDVWSSASEIGATSPVWGNKSIDMGIQNGDIFNSSMNMSSSVQNNYAGSSSMRPNMTRQQAQKYLIEMGYSLSDAIGALVRNQMDIHKAIIDLQNRYRNKPSNPPSVNSFSQQNSFPPYSNSAGASNDILNGMSEMGASGSNNLSRMTPSLMGCQSNSSSGTPFSMGNFGATNSLDMMPENNEQFLDNRTFEPSFLSGIGGNNSSNMGSNRLSSGIMGNNTMNQSNMARVPPLMHDQPSNLMRGNGNGNGFSGLGNNNGPQQMMSPVTNQARPITSGGGNNSNFNAHQDPMALASMNNLGQSMNRLNLSNQYMSASGGLNNNMSSGVPNTMSHSMRLQPTHQNNNNNVGFSGQYSHNNQQPQQHHMMFPKSSLTSSCSGNGLPNNSSFMQSSQQQNMAQFSRSQSLISNTNNQAAFQNNPAAFKHSLQAPQQGQMFHRNNSVINNWHSSSTDHFTQSVNNSNHGALSDFNNNPSQTPININSHNRLAKNFSYPNGLTYDGNKMCGIIVRKIQHINVEHIKAIFAELKIRFNFHLVGQTQSMLLQLSNVNEAYYCIEKIKERLPNLRAEIINSHEEYCNYLSGAN